MQIADIISFTTRFCNIHDLGQLAVCDSRLDFATLTQRLHHSELAKASFDSAWFVTASTLTISQLDSLSRVNSYYNSIARSHILFHTKLVLFGIL